MCLLRIRAFLLPTSRVASWPRRRWIISDNIVREPLQGSAAATQLCETPTITPRNVGSGVRTPRSVVPGMYTSPCCSSVRTPHTDSVHVSLALSFLVYAHLRLFLVCARHALFVVYPHLALLFLSYLHLVLLLPVYAYPVLFPGVSAPRISWCSTPCTFWCVYASYFLVYVCLALSGVFTPRVVSGEYTPRAFPGARTPCTVSSVSTPRY